MEYPIINREIVDFTSDSEVCNIGWYEGVMDANRPYRIEVWSAFGIDTATIFISTIDLENKSASDLKKMIAANDIIDIEEDRIDVTRTVDQDDNEFYSINVPLSDHGEEVNKVLVTLNDYYFE